MTNLAGYWTGTFGGTNNGGVSLSIEQSGDSIGGLATMQEPSIGVYNYAVSGVAGEPIKFKLQPRTNSPATMLGVLDVTCTIDKDGLLTGRWQSSIGTNGVFHVRRYKDPDTDNTSKPERTSVFMSYSHTDTEFLEELSVHLKPLEKAGLVDTWSDQRIHAGSLWKKEIDSALERASVAVLLISPQFLASDFIVDNELPPILTKAYDKGLRVLPIILKPCRFTRDPNLSQFQAVNDPKNPLARMELWERDEIYDRISNEIENLSK